MTETLPEPPRLLRVADLARLMQVSVRTVWRLRSLGILPTPVRVGGSVRWERQTVETWLATGCQSRRMPPPKG